MSVKEPEALQDTDGRWAAFSVCTNCGEEIWEYEQGQWEHRWTETVMCLATTAATPDGTIYDFSNPRGIRRILTSTKLEQCAQCRRYLDDELTPEELAQLGIELDDGQWIQPAECIFFCSEKCVNKYGGAI